MKKKSLILVALVALVVSAFAVPAQAGSAKKSISVGDYYFVKKGASPAKVTVKKGTKVTFKWVGKVIHDVRVSKGPAKFNSKYQAKGTYSRTVTKRGTYHIVCDLHSNMELTLKVN